jgi:hypothetical protein
MNKKLILPLTIMLSFFILGGFVYAVQVAKQRSLEQANKQVQ